MTKEKLFDKNLEECRFIATEPIDYKKEDIVWQNLMKEAKEKEKLFDKNIAFNDPILAELINAYAVKAASLGIKSEAKTDEKQAVSGFDYNKD